MTKIIHCADLHLDSPMETHMTEEQASIRNTEIIHTFLRLTEYAAKNDVRAVIIAGDMFDGERIKIRTVDEILDAIRRTPNVDYLYLVGNHDGATYAFADHDMPDNLKIFGNFFFVKVKDETRMTINPEDYKNDISLKGEFIRLTLSSDASEEDKAAIIRTGMQALMGEEITL